MGVSEPFDNKPVRRSGILLILGLFVEALSLRWNHPLATDLLFPIGLLLMGGGMALLIYSFVRHFVRRRKIRRSD